MWKGGLLDLSQFDSYPQVVKAWGREIWLCNTPLYCAKLLVITPGFQCSLHRHLVKDETFFMLEGRYACAQFQDEAFQVLSPGTEFHVPPGRYHRFWVPKAFPQAVLLEISTQHSDDDVERLEESGPYQGAAARPAPG